MQREYPLARASSIEFMRKNSDIAKLLEDFSEGSVVAAARLITIIENGGPRAEAAMDGIFPLTRGAYRIGFTGPPGAGKSSLIYHLARVIRDSGRTVGIIAVDPVDYLTFLLLEKCADLILTDSGGVQEEACILGVPCVTLRDNTERPEAVEAGAARLVGVSTEAIVEGVSTLLTDPAEYAACQIDRNPYGDGRAAERIVDLMLRMLRPQ